jgi:CheY-like chemotaxis protein
MDDSGVILPVDDYHNDVELTLAALGENRPAPEAIVCNVGEDALDLLYRRGAYRARPTAYPRAVLSDIKLPKANGLGVLERIKVDPDLKSIPVMMLTALREKRDLLRSYELDTNAYIVKPMAYDGVVEAVREVGLFWGSFNQLPSTVGRDR